MRHVIALCVGLCIGHSPLFAQLPPGSVALYPFNNSATDVSGNGYDGTLMSTSSDQFQQFIDRASHIRSNG